LVTAPQESADYPLAQKELEFSSGRSVKTKNSHVYLERQASPEDACLGEAVIDGVEEGRYLGVYHPDDSDSKRV